MESLAIRMGVSVRTVQRAINDLEKANLLDKKPTSKSDNRYGRLLYTSPSPRDSGLEVVCPLLH
ncbi:helix-turn-helix domain-containing protein [Enterobacter hormaechei]